MIKQLLVFLFCFCSVLTAQEESPQYAAVASQFMEEYNAANYEAIFSMFDENMKKALPREQTLQFFRTNVNNPMGQIRQMDFFSIKSGAHVYRTRFDRAVANILISLDNEQMINGLFISPPKNENAPVLSRNATEIMLPFNGEWFVYWGGETIENNYHVAEDSQKYAYDIVKVKDGKSYDGDPLKNESYYAFGEDIIAPCDGTVEKVINGVHDNVPGELNPNQLTGNTIVLKTRNNEYILFAHLMENSIIVEKGQEVLKGEKLAQCGNSGNSTEPHLHLSLQNTRDMVKATGAKLYFDRILVNGEEKMDYLPIKEDLIKNIE